MENTHNDDMDTINKSFGYIVIYRVMNEIMHKFHSELGSIVRS